MTHDLRLEDYLLGFLDRAEREEVELHLSECADCRAERDRVRELLHRLDDIPAACPAAESFVAGVLQRAVPKRRIAWEGVIMMTAASILMVSVVWLYVAPQDPGPGRQETSKSDAPRAREIDQWVEKLSDRDPEAREKAEKQFESLVKDLEYAVAALQKARDSSDAELKARAERVTKALTDAAAKVRAKGAPAVEVRNREFWERELVLAEKEINDKPQTVAAWLRRARARLELGQVKEALADAESALRLDPAGAAAWLIRGRIAFATGDLDGALRDYTRAIEVDPSQPEAFDLRGAAKLAAKRFEEAIADYDRALALDPARAGAYQNRGAARKMLGDLEGAKADFERALQLEPDRKKR